MSNLMCFLSLRSVQVLLCLIFCIPCCQVEAWHSSLATRPRYSKKSRNKQFTTELYKKRKSRSDGEDPDQWYEAVEADASPDDGKSLICFSMLEHQRVVNRPHN